jgi:hypothetical protein
MTISGRNAKPHDRGWLVVIVGFAGRSERRPDESRSLPVDYLPIIFIVSAVVVIGLIWAALNVTIKRDRETIRADMDEPHEIEAYKKAWRKKK